MSAAEIAKRTKTKRREVKAALSVGASELASATASRYDFINLEQAAVVAEFEDDAEAVKALVVAARNGGFDHLTQRLRDDRAERAVNDAEVRRLADQGVACLVNLFESVADLDGCATCLLQQASTGQRDRRNHVPYVYVAQPGRPSGGGTDGEHDNAQHRLVTTDVD